MEVWPQIRNIENFHSSKVLEPIKNLTVLRLQNEVQLQKPNVLKEIIIDVLKKYFIKF